MIEPEPSPFPADPVRSAVPGVLAAGTVVTAYSVCSGFGCTPGPLDVAVVLPGGAVLCLEFRLTVLGVTLLGAGGLGLYGS